MAAPPTSPGPSLLPSTSSSVLPPVLARILSYASSSSRKMTLGSPVTSAPSGQSSTCSASSGASLLNSRSAFTALTCSRSPPTPCPFFEAYSLPEPAAYRSDEIQPVMESWLHMHVKSGRRSIHPSGGVLGMFCGYTMRSRSFPPDEMGPASIPSPLLFLSLMLFSRSSRPSAASHAMLYISPAYRRNCVKLTLECPSPVMLFDPPVLVRSTTLRRLVVTEMAVSSMASLAMRAEAEWGMVRMASVCLCFFWIEAGVSCGLGGASTSLAELYNVCTRCDDGLNERHGKANFLGALVKKLC
mmetsp:Transcript_17100/g.36936  ORF Transcript_17100/g.36936 Transcript_17100/m.36936 type:complete len:300 (-) Transcript_17100:364-1263(-)